MKDEQSATVKALQTAIQMEIDGKQYYLKASQNSRNGLGQKLFLTLAGEEDIHRRNFEKIFMAIQSKKQWPGVESTSHAAGELKKLFSEATRDGGGVRTPISEANRDSGERKTVFSEASKDIQAAASELEAVQTAMAMENKTHDFYKQQAETSSFEAEKKYYSLIAGEESAHHAALLDYYEYLNNPGQYFTMKERQSLDGG
ncbi:MAG TPA: ferritin family protein [Dehalococcoidales bacterium]